MLRLLEEARWHKALPTPVVCVIGMRGRLSLAALHAFEQAAQALGASAVLDMAKFPDDRPGNERLQTIIREFLPREGLLQT